MIPSVNFHLWEPCNMRCRFCFATFQDVKSTILPKGHLPKEDAIRVVEELAKCGYEKITFVGGEPTLCPWLPELISTAKERGLTTMIVSNGSRLTFDLIIRLRGCLDWITLSIDSLTNESNFESGRAIGGKRALSKEQYFHLSKMIKSNSFGFKVNTVVHKKNYRENLSELIEFCMPDRWKIFQVLPIKGQNDKHIDEFIISEKEFEHFINCHKHLTSFTRIVIENNDSMTGSYAMIDPSGRFFDNISGEHRYSESILKVGARKAIQQIKQDYSKFINREGLYEWQR